MPRGPLPWLLALEAVVLVALAFFGWRLVTDRLVKPAPPPSAAVAHLPIASPRPPARPPSPSPLPVPGSTTAPATDRGTAAALSFDPRFWRQHLTQVNHDESAWESAQWRVTQAVEAFARAYIEAVVVPAVRNANGRSGT